MKTTIKTIILLLIPALIYLSGCSKKNSGPIVGTRSVKRMITATNYNGNMTTEDTTYASSGGSVTFTDDGHVLSTALGNGFNGTYSISGSTLSTHYSGLGDGTATILTLTDHSLVVLSAVDTVDPSPLYTIQTTTYMTK